MGDSYGSFYLVDVLSSFSAAPVGIKSQILPADLNIHLLCFRQYRYTDGGSVNTPLCFGVRDALYPVYAAFVLHGSIDIVTAYFEGHLPEPSGHGAFIEVKCVALPALLFGIPLVHSGQVGGKERGLFSAGSSPDLYNDVA